MEDKKATSWQKLKGILDEDGLSGLYFLLGDATTDG